MRQKILFVDDDLNILAGLKRMLRSMRHLWDLEFANSGPLALSKLAGGDYDIVVSDMKMPQMSGAELLGRIQEEYPQVSRIILSGQSDEEMAMKTVGTAHQYLAKPCNPEVLIHTLKNIASIRGILSNKQVKSLLSGKVAIPSLPSLYQEFIAEVESKNCSLVRLACIIQKDPGMTATILKIVNSAFFGLQQRTTRIDQALNYLGIDTIKSLVLSAQLFKEFSEEKLQKYHLHNLWEKSVLVGYLAKELSVAGGYGDKLEADAYMAGNLHDIGKLIFMDIFEYFERLNLECMEVDRANWRIGHADFEINQCEVGAFVVGLWGLPGAIVDSIRYYRAPSRCETSDARLLGAVHAASVFAQMLDESEEVELTVHRFLTSDLADVAFFEKHGLTAQVEPWVKRIGKIMGQGSQNDE